MTGEEIAVMLAEQGKEIGSLKHRMDDQEEQAKTLNDLAVSVRELAVNMRNMIDEQRRAGKRLDKLEQEPANNWRSLKKTLLTALVSAISGAVITALVAILTQFT